MLEGLGDEAEKTALLGLVCHYENSGFGSWDVAQLEYLPRVQKVLGLTLNASRMGRFRLLLGCGGAIKS